MTETSCVLIVALSTLLQVASGPQQTPSTPAVSESVRELNDIAARRSAGEAADVHGLIRKGLRDNDERVQLSALWALISRASGDRFKSDPEARMRGTVERPQLATLKDEILAKVTSPNPKIRYAALAALASLDYDPEHGARAIRLTPEMITLLLARYQLETDVWVRSEIVKAVALDKEATGGEALLVQALSDSAPGVIQHAVRGVAGHRLLQQLPALERLLDHADAGVRVSVANAFGSLGPDAAGSLRALQLALAGEQEPDVRSALSGAISAVQRAK